MITIDDIKKWSKPHPVTKGDGRMSRFGNKNIEFSIVGGARGLYGNFEKTFEVAIFDRKTNNFVTHFFSEKNDGDVIGFMSSEELEKLVNSVIKIEDLSVEK